MIKWRRTSLLLITAAMLAVMAGCGGNNKDASPAPSASGAATPTPSAAPVTVRFSEVIRSIFYAPHYIAMSKGFFKEEGINLDLNTAQGSDKGAAALLAGTADISLIGPETAIYIYNQKGDKKLKIFYQLTMNDGSFLLSRTPVSSFKWSDLSGKKVIGWRPGSSPQMLLNATLAKEGVKGVDVVTNLASPAMAGAFTSGQGDYIQLFEPVASTLVKSGKAYYATSLGEAFGPYPETSYVATSDYISQHPDVLQHFTNAVAKGAKWLSSASDDDIAAALAPYFEGTSKDLIVQSIQRYKKQGTWTTNPEITAEQFKTLQTVLIDNGVLKAEGEVKDMSAIVDMTFVQKLAKE